MSWGLDRFERGAASLSSSTRNVYRRDLEAFVAWAETQGLDRPDVMTKASIRRYLGSLAGHADQPALAPATVRRKVSALRRYFGWLAAGGEIVVDPMVGVSSPRGGNRLPRILTADQIHQMLDEPPAVEGVGRSVGDRAEVLRNMRDDAVLEILYGSGLRVSEVCGIRSTDIDLDAGAITIVGKGATQRRVPLSGPSTDALHRWIRQGRVRWVATWRPAKQSAKQSGGQPAETLDLREPEALFLNQRCQPLTPRDVRRILDRRAPIPTHPHAIRHSFATHLLDGPGTKAPL